MRCSFCEAQISAFVDGELGPVARARIARHLATCDACAAFATELRSIDALLSTGRAPEPADNFSCKVMAEVRTMPAPHVHRSPHVAVLATYVVFAWAAIGTFLAFGGASARAMLATLAAAFGRLSAVAGNLAAATGHLFGRHVFDVTAAMGALLGLDLVVGGVLLAAYAVVRGRRAAALAGPDTW